MQLLNFSDPLEIFIWILILWVSVFLRYVLVAGAFYVIFYIFFKEKYWHRKISKRLRRANQHWKEIFWSACSALIFAVAGLGLLWLWQEGYTNLYMGNEYSIVVTLGGLLLALLLHDTYYYWLHRWMHRPKVYKWFHRVHHDSIVTSPWTSFSFHPLECLLQAIFVPFMVIFLPMHVGAVLAMLTIMTVTAVINHLDIEIYPKHFEQHWIGKWIIGATHHSLHHKRFIKNYGLYFTFWDKWMKTESPEFEQLFRDKTH